MSNENSKTPFTVLGVLILAVFMLPIGMAAYPRIMKVTGADKPAESNEKRELIKPKLEKWVSQGPYMTRRKCCKKEEDCCTPGPCHDLTVVFADTGTALDGTYTAVWQSTGTPRWTFTANSCDWEIIAVNSSGGVNYLREVGGTCQLSGTCTQIGTCTEPTPTATIEIKPSDTGCNFCSLGDLVGSTIEISWPCHYPEYFEILTDIADDRCDCSAFLNMQVPINCSSSTPLTALWYETTFADCDSGLQVVVAWDCSTKKLRFEVGGVVPVTYETSVLTFNELVAGSSFVLSRTSSNEEICTFPATVTIQGFNNGNWCP